MVENLYQQYVNAGNEEEAAALLTDYSRDYFGAAVGRWDDLGRHLWYQHWKGF
ncbi:MAG: hypothetical protein K2H15_04165 [Muribaculaceae bacterium]|nr:hypothetical protein [Muribaculaceae bacterium]